MNDSTKKKKTKQKKSRNDLTNNIHVTVTMIIDSIVVMAMPFFLVLSFTDHKAFLGHSRVRVTMLMLLNGTTPS